MERKNQEVTKWQREKDQRLVIHSLVHLPVKPWYRKVNLLAAASWFLVQF